MFHLFQVLHIFCSHAHFLFPCTIFVWFRGKNILEQLSKPRFFTEFKNCGVFFAAFRFRWKVFTKILWINCTILTLNLFLSFFQMVAGGILLLVTNFLYSSIGYEGMFLLSGVFGLIGNIKFALKFPQYLNESGFFYSHRNSCTLEI